MVLSLLNGFIGIINKIPRYCADIKMFCFAKDYAVAVARCYEICSGFVFWFLTLCTLKRMKLYPGVYFNKSDTKDSACFDNFNNFKSNLHEDCHRIVYK